MRLVLVLILVGSAYAIPQRRTATQPPMRCPPPNYGSMGPCVIGPNSCLNHSECPYAHLCCPSGCGKECMRVSTPTTTRRTTPRPKPTTTRASYRPTPRPSCPRVTPGYGQCVRDPYKNCYQNSNCYGGKICCPAACGKECMMPAPQNYGQGQITTVW